MTGQQVENVVYTLVKASDLSSKINGSLYKYGTRPPESKAEDLVVRFVSGISDQISSGIVSIHVFIANVDNMRDIARCAEIEQACDDFGKSMNRVQSEYYFLQEEMIASFYDSEISQYFVSMKLKFKSTII